MAGSQAKGFAGTALTGLVGNLTVQEAAGMGSSNGNYSQVGTAVGFPPNQNAPMVSLIDGSWVIPPGGILALLCTTNPPVAVSAVSSLMWEEVPI